MNAEMVVALLMSTGLILLGLASGWLQVRGMRSLFARKLVPSDEFAYLRGRYRRRMLIGFLLVVIGGLIAGIYVSGLGARIDELSEKRPTDADGEKRPMTPDEKQLFRVYGGLWVGVLVMTFAVIGLAMADGLASRRYWLKLYREMREEHNTQLRRDLAVYRQQAEHKRTGGDEGPGYGGRLGTGPQQ